MLMMTVCASLCAKISQAVHPSVLTALRDVTLQMRKPKPSEWLTNETVGFGLVWFGMVWFGLV